ncbi:TPA: metal ABC transporter permease, partial [Streptococcus pyogenes]
MLDILSYDFMQRAVMAVVAISIFAPILGIFLILRRQSLMSDTLSHVSLAGVALGVVLGISPTITTIIVVVLAAILLEYLRVVYKHYMEISTAIL